MADEEGWEIVGPSTDSAAGRRRGGAGARRARARRGGGGGRAAQSSPPNFQYREQPQPPKKQSRGRPGSDEDDSVNASSAVQRWHARLSGFQQELESSAFLVEVKKVLERAGALDDGQARVAAVVCYGIGNFSSSKRAGYQFALLLLLRRWLAVEEPVRLFEPFLTEFEKGVLPDHGCELIAKNEEAKRVAQCRTLFFMPHVDKCLYSNLLWANWGEDSLPNVLIFGNSFEHYDERIISYAERRKAPYMFKISFCFQSSSLSSTGHPSPLEVMDEHRIERAFGGQKEAFNDQSVIAFRRRGDKMAQAVLNDAAFWSRSPEADLPSLAHGSSDVVSGPV